MDNLFGFPVVEWKDPPKHSDIILGDWIDYANWPIIIKGHLMELKWISVTEKLPEEGDEIWIYDKDYGVCIGHYFKGHWMENDDHHDPTDLWRVTHWMPLIEPEPPTENA